MSPPKRKLDALFESPKSDGELDTAQTSQILRPAPQLPPPSARMQQLSREIRVVEHQPNSSSFIEQASPASFKRQRNLIPMELTGIQNTVAMSTPNKPATTTYRTSVTVDPATGTRLSRAEEAPNRAGFLARNYDSSALEEAFEADQTSEINILVDAENEPPEPMPEPSPVRRPNIAPFLSPVQEATEESDTGAAMITAPVLARRSLSAPPSPVASAVTAPIRSIPATPRLRTPRQLPLLRPVQRSANASEPSQRSPQRAISSASQRSPQHARIIDVHSSLTQPLPFDNISRMAANLSPRRTPQRVPQTPRHRLAPQQKTPAQTPSASRNRVISIPSSPFDPASPSRRASMRSDESFSHVDPKQLDSMDALINYLGILDFDPKPLENVLPSKELIYSSLDPSDEIYADELKAEIDRLIDAGIDLDSQIKDKIEALNYPQVGERFKTTNRSEKLLLRKRMNNLQEYLQARSEIHAVEAETDMVNATLDKVLALKKAYQHQVDNFDKMVQDCDGIRKEITKLDELKHNETDVETEITSKMRAIESKYEEIRKRRERLASAVNHTPSGPINAEKFDLLQEDITTLYFHKQYRAKVGTLDALYGIKAIMFLPGGGFSARLDGLELLYRAPRQKFTLTDQGVVSRHFFQFLSDMKEPKENLRFWKTCVTIQQEVQKLRRLGYSEFQQSGNSLKLLVTLPDGKVDVNFRDGKVVLLCTLNDRDVEEQVLRSPALDAIKLLLKHYRATT